MSQLTQFKNNKMLYNEFYDKTKALLQHGKCLLDSMFYVSIGSYFVFPCPSDPAYSPLAIF